MLFIDGYSQIASPGGLDSLHEDMKWSAGGGLHIMTNHLVVRLDVASSDEDVIAQLFLSHPWPKH